MTDPRLAGALFGTRAELESLEQGFRDGEFAWDKLPVAVET